MKYLIISLLVLLSSSILKAAIITVDNRDNTTAMYHDLQTAIDNANEGDTLLIHRSSSTYGNINLNKRLVLIGEGANPNKPPFGTTKIDNLTLSYDENTLANASKSSIIGFDISRMNLYEQGVDASIGVDSILIKNCRIYQVYLKGKVEFLSLIKNLIYAVTQTGNGGALKSNFQNNIFNSFSTHPSVGQDNIFVNNIFLSNVTARSSVFANNIFYSSGNLVNNSSNGVFSNNLLFSETSSIDTNSFMTNGSTLVNPIFGDPLFITVVNPNVWRTQSHTAPASGPFVNYNTQPGSPAIAAGTDGTDLGIYGGPNPWRDGATGDSRYKYFPLPDAVPVITGVQVQNPVVNHGGNLQVEIKGTTKP